MVATGQGKVLMDSFRQVIVEMDDCMKEIRCAKKKPAADFSASLSETTIVFASLLALVLTA